MSSSLSIPSYFSMNKLSPEDVKRIARFRLGSHFLIARSFYPKHSSLSSLSLKHALQII
jgi:hypothetical protein